jgi:hypothetical protein
MNGWTGHRDVLREKYIMLTNFTSYVLKGAAEFRIFRNEVEGIGGLICAEPRVTLLLIRKVRREVLCLCRHGVPPCIPPY